jgi:hypothetical protein
MSALNSHRLSVADRIARQGENGNDPTLACTAPIGRPSDLSGITAMLAATGTLAVGDSFTKLVTKDLPPFEVLFLLIAAGLVCAVLLTVHGEWRVYAVTYLARLQTSSAVHPADAVGTMYFISSPVTVSGRFCSTPLQFGNVLDSIRKMRVL